MMHKYLMIKFRGKWAREFLDVWSIFLYFHALVIAFDLNPSA